MSRRKRVRRVVVLAALGLGIAAPTAQARPTGATAGGLSSPPVAESGATSGAALITAGSPSGYTWGEAGIGAGAAGAVIGMVVVAGRLRPRGVLER